MRQFLLSVCCVWVAACSDPQPPAGSNVENAPLAQGLNISDPWAQPSPGGVDVAAGYLTIANGGAADRLLSIASPRAGRVEVHEMRMDGATMRMREVEGGLEIPANATVTLAPHGLHLMFMGVAQPFAAGEEIPIRLTFERAGVREVRLAVRER